MRVTKELQYMIQNSVSKQVAEQSAKDDILHQKNRNALREEMKKDKKLSMAVTAINERYEFYSEKAKKVGLEARSNGFYNDDKPEEFMYLSIPNDYGKVSNLVNTIIVKLTYEKDTAKIQSILNQFNIKL